MTVWYLHQYFRTPQQGGATRSYTLARALVQAGVNVHVVTAHAEPAYAMRTVEGITVHYLPVAYGQKMDLGQRGRAFVGFVRAVLYWAAQQPEKPGLLYATSTPLTVGYLAYRLRKKYGIPYVFEVRDLWPDVPFQMLPPLRLLAPGLRYWEKRIYRQAKGIVALSPPMAEAIRRRAPHVRVETLPNFADSRLFQPKPRTDAWHTRWQVPKSKRVLAYTGSIGRANAPATLVEYVKSTADTLVHWVMVGEGSHYAQVQEALAGATHVSWFGPVPKPDVAELLGGADAACVTFLEGPAVLGTNSPNKLFEALAAGCAILSNRPGWYTDLVTQAGAGMQVQPKELSRQVEGWERHPEALTEMQRRARTLSEAHTAEGRAQQWLAALRTWDCIP